MDFSTLEVVSPKRTRAALNGWQGFFPYYAGYPVPFAQKIVSSAKLRSGAVILDPWNGSGTTTFVAAEAGISSIGYDLNPVMVVVARARTLPASEADALVPLARKIVELSQDGGPPALATDELLAWCDEPTARAVRGIETTIRETLVGEKTLEGHPDLSLLAAIAATQYVALFRVLRLLAASLKTTNPTWLKKPKTAENKIRCAPHVIYDSFIFAAEEMSSALMDRRTLLPSAPASTQILNRDSAAATELNASIDFVLTSPPYCTRIDYAASTALELAVLQYLRERNVPELRSSMMGTTLAPKAGINIESQWGATCQEFMKAVLEHPSKASTGYYYRTHLDYFSKLSRSIQSIGASLKTGGGAVLVVQDSYYKDIHNDLAQIAIEMCVAGGLVLERRDDFAIARTMAGRHRHVKSYRATPTAVESVLCFSKH